MLRYLSRTALLIFNTLVSVESFTFFLPNDYNVGLLSKTAGMIKTPTILAAKKKGFGKKSPKSKKSNQPSVEDVDEEEPSSMEKEYTPLQSIENPSPSRPKLNVDPNLPTEERTKQILQKQYGLQSFEERQGDMKAQEQLKRFKELQKQAKEDENFDIFGLIPAPVIIFVDRFLKFGLGVTTVIFIAAGVGITFEAWSAATGNPLQEGMGDFIVNVVEPNFTTCLLVLLGFSISLGVFSLGQLGSKGSQYQEKP